MIPRAYAGKPPQALWRNYNGAITVLSLRARAFLLSPPRYELIDPGQPSAGLTILPQQGFRTMSIASLLHSKEGVRAREHSEESSSVSSATGDESEIVTVHGWIRSNRNMKKYSFLHLVDGTTSQPLQAVIPKEEFGNTKALTTGTCIQITGDWKSSPGSKQHQQAKELHYKSLSILGLADPETFPLQKKYHSPEYLRTMPHLRIRLTTQAALLQLRSWVTSQISMFFTESDFVQVHPPIITSSDCEGAGEVFTVSTSPSDEEELPSPSLAVEGKKTHALSSPSSALNPEQKEKDQHHFFRGPKYLTVSSQLHLECFAHAIPQVWTLSPTFRAEKSDTNRHLSEFYMLEAEMSFTKKLEDVMSVVEDMTRFVVSGLFDSRVGKEIAEIYFNKSSEETAAEDPVDSSMPLRLESRWKSLLSPQRWTRMTYTEAIKHLSEAATKGEARFAFEPIWGNALQAEHEKFLAAKFGSPGGEGGGGPVFVTDYPRGLKPFYMLPSDHSSSSSSETDTVACFDLLLPHIGELVGGSLREHRYDELLTSMKLHGLIPASPISSNSDFGSTENNKEDDLGTLKWYLDLRKWGTVPHGGFGMGFDRLMAYLAGVRDVREVVGFPRWRGRCDC